jgi:hypothetical protein
MMELLSDTETNTCKKNILTIHKILRIMQRNNPDAENQIFVYILTYIYAVETLIQKLNSIKEK